MFGFDRLAIVLLVLFALLGVLAVLSFVRRSRPPAEKPPDDHQEW
jgi:hypothetical protein